MTKLSLDNAWKWLFTQLLVTIIMTYFFAMLMVKLNWVTVAGLFRVATYNLRAISGPLLDCFTAFVSQPSPRGPRSAR